MVTKRESSVQDEHEDDEMLTKLEQLLILMREYQVDELELSDIKIKKSRHPAQQNVEQTKQEEYKIPDEFILEKPKHRLV